MLEKNKQEVTNVHKSFVQQANGNIINYGFGYSDIKEICHDVVRQELSIVTKEASETLKNEIVTFENQFVERLINLENQQVIEKLKTPKLQFSLHATMKEFVKTEVADTKEELLDLFIERLKVEEHTTEQFLIDEAIDIIPKLSRPALFLLGALTQRKIVNHGFAFIVNNSLKTQADLYEYLDELSNLDIEYLKQINCCSPISGLRHYIGLIDMMKKNYDLLFIKAISKQEYETRVLSNPQIPSEIKHHIMFIDGTQNEECKLLFSSKIDLVKYLENNGIIQYLSVIEDFINSLPVFNDSEIKQYLISLNKNWEKAFKVLDMEAITNIELTPVGTYIGRRIMKKIMNRNTLPLQDFYK